MKSFYEELQQIKQSCLSREHQEKVAAARRILSEKPFALFGAGAEGVKCADILNFLHIEPVCFCDEYKSGTEPHTGLPIISPQELLNEYKDVNIVITTSLYCAEIGSKLVKLGVAENRILSRRLILLLVPLCSGGGGDPLRQIFGKTSLSYGIQCFE